MTNNTDIFLCRGFTGQIYRLSVNARRNVEHLIPDIALAMGLYSSDASQLGLYNLTRDIEYDAGDTLEGKGISNGDLLIVAHGGSCHKK